MYRACIFDLDGTLTDTLESLTYSVNATLRELGLREITMEQCRQFVGNGAKYLMEQALRASGDPELHLIESGLETYKRIFGKHCMYHVKPYEGIVEMLSELYKRGIRLAVVSNKPHQQAVDVVSEVFETDYFDRVCGQRDGIARKPDPEGVLETIEALGVERDACIYIGDSEVDVETARRAGIPSVGVTWGFRSRAVLEKAGAQYLIDQPQDIFRIVEKQELFEGGF